MSVEARVCPVDGTEFTPRSSTHVYCKQRCRQRAGLERQRREQEARRLATANLAAADRMVTFMRDGGRLEEIDEPRVAAMLTLARAVDSDPLNAGLWREYREAEAALRGVGVMERDDHDALMAMLAGGD